MTDPRPAFSLRPAQAADFPAVRALIHAAQINPMGLDWRRFTLAVDDQGRMIGCGQIKPHSDGTRELASIAVIPAWRERGVASAIIQYLLTIAPPPLYLTCRASLGLFYARFGFRRILPPDLPPYFRRIERLARGLQRLGAFKGQEMWVMKWD